MAHYGAHPVHMYFFASVVRAAMLVDVGWAGFMCFQVIWNSIAPDVKISCIGTMTRVVALPPCHAQCLLRVVLLTSPPTVHPCVCSNLFALVRSSVPTRASLCSLVWRCPTWCATFATDWMYLDAWYYPKPIYRNARGEVHPIHASADARHLDTNNSKALHSARSSVHHVAGFAICLSPGLARRMPFRAYHASSKQGRSVLCFSFFASSIKTCMLSRNVARSLMLSLHKIHLHVFA